MLSPLAWVVFAEEEAAGKAIGVVAGNLLAIRGRHAAEAGAVTNTSTRVQDVRVTDGLARLENLGKIAGNIGLISLF